MKTPLKTLVTGLTLLAFATLTLQPSTAFAQGSTAFTYQGQLSDGGTNANGIYTMIFNLYDAASSGDLIGGPIQTNATLANGLFSVNLDFGGGAFPGGARWLDITVQCGTNTPETLTPRVQVLPAPYALYSGTAGTAAGLGSGTWNGSVGNYPGHANVFGILDNGSLVMGLSSNDVMVNGGLQANSVDVGTNITAGGEIEAKGPNASFIVGDTNGNWLAQIDSGGNINANGYINAGGNITATGGFSVNDTNGGWLVKIDSGGNLSAEGINAGGNISGGSITGGTIIAEDQAAGITITSYGDIHMLNGCDITISGGHGSLILNGGIEATSFTTSSDSNLKENFATIDNQDILQRVVSLPISQWNFKTDEKTRHLGPMAQDFYAAFNVGRDDKHIATVDEGGVALAAIQGLNEKLNEKLKAKDAQIEALEKRLSEVEAILNSSAQK